MGVMRGACTKTRQGKHKAGLITNPPDHKSPPRQPPPCYCVNAYYAPNRRINGGSRYHDSHNYSNGQTSTNSSAKSIYQSLCRSQLHYRLKTKCASAFHMFNLEQPPPPPPAVPLPFSAPLFLLVRKFSVSRAKILQATSRGFTSSGTFKGSNNYHP